MILSALFDAGMREGRSIINTPLGHDRLHDFWPELQQFRLPDQKREPVDLSSVTGCPDPPLNEHRCAPEETGPFA